MRFLVNPGRKVRRNADILDAIRMGDKVTIRVHAGGIGKSAEYREKTGTAVMRGPHGWVLNMGGRYGTPAVASDANIVKVRQVKGNPGRGAKPRISRAKALTILREGRTHGRPLTAKQRRFFGARAAGAPVRTARTRTGARRTSNTPATAEGTMARKRKRARRSARRRSPVRAVRRTVRRRRRRTVHHNPVRAHRRSHRRAHRRSGRVHRNPRMSVRGISNLLMEGAKDAAGLIAGRAVNRVIRKVVPIATDTAVKQVAVGVGAAVVSGYALSLVSPRMGRLAVAIGLADTVTPLLTGLPVVGAYLGDSFLGDSFLGAYPQPAMGAIPMTTGPTMVPGLGAYPQPAMGEYDGDGMY